MWLDCYISQGVKKRARSAPAQVDTRDFDAGDLCLWPKSTSAKLGFWSLAMFACTCMYLVHLGMSGWKTLRWHWRYNRRSPRCFPWNALKAGKPGSIWQMLPQRLTPHQRFLFFRTCSNRSDVQICSDAGPLNLFWRSLDRREVTIKTEIILFRNKTVVLYIVWYSDSQRKFRSSNFRLYWKLPVALAASMFSQQRCFGG